MSGRPGEAFGSASGRLAIAHRQRQPNSRKTAPVRWRSLLFHVKHWIASTVSSHLLLDWQRRVNLIAPSTEPVLWTRHIADSLQLLALAPGAGVWADLGSGAGFPGLVVACALAETARARACTLWKAAPRRPPFCAKRSAPQVLRLPSTRCGSRISSKAPREHVRS